MELLNKRSKGESNGKEWKKESGYALASVLVLSFYFREATDLISYSCPLVMELTLELGTAKHYTHSYKDYINS